MVTGLVVAAALAWALAVWLWLGAIRGPGIFRRLNRLAVGALVLVIALLLSGGAVLLRAFQAFSGEELIARVRCHRVGPDSFELTYLPAAAPPSQARTVVLKGDQWAISGGIIKWHPWLTAAGVRSYHRPMRLAGQYVKLERQRAEPPTVESLSPGADLFWEALYAADPYLPFVEAVYGTAAYVYVEPGRVQEVYVTPSGYLIKRAEYEPAR